MTQINFYRYNIYNNTKTKKKMLSIPSFCKKYKILKLQSEISSKVYQYVPNETYLVSIRPNQSIRKYKKVYDFSEDMFQINQWRSDITAQIIHCYFLQLKYVQKEQNTIECEVYLQHMEIALKDMKKLMIQQSVYLIFQAIKGYQELLKKFQKVSVNLETIGLNSQGKCVVWINKQLECIEAQEEAFHEENSVIKKIVELVMQKNEPKSQNILKKIIEFINKKKVNTDEILSYITSLCKNIKINVPLNLKYLVSQFRIIKEVQNFKLKNIQDIKNQSIEKIKEIKSARKRPSYKEDIFPSPKNKKVLIFHQHSPKIKFLNDEGPKNIASQSPFADLIIKDKLFINSKNEVNRNNFPKRFSYMQSKFQKNSNNGMSSIAATKESNSKSNGNSNFSSIFIPSNNNQKLFSNQKTPQEKGRVHQYKFSKSLQKLQENVMINSKFSQRAKSVKGENKERVTKSQMDEMKSKFKQNKHIFQQCQQNQSSPKKQTPQNQKELLMLNLFDRKQTKEMNEVENQQKMMMQNNWTARLDSNRFWMQANMNTSITLEQSSLARPSKYLEDVKLQRLDMLNMHITTSIIAHQYKC